MRYAYGKGVGDIAMGFTVNLMIDGSTPLPLQGVPSMINGFHFFRMFTNNYGCRPYMPVYLLFGNNVLELFRLDP